MDELKPCPFCGGEAEIVAYKGDGLTTYYVQCASISCFCETGHSDDELGAVEMWNKRV